MNPTCAHPRIPAASRALAAASAGLVAALAAPPAAAQSALGALDQRFWVQLGAWRPAIDSSARLDARSGGGTGTPLDLEADAGLLGHRTALSLAGGIRLDSRWRAEFETFGLRRTGRQRPGTLPVAFGDASFTGDVDGRLDARVWRASAGYSFVRSPQVELGASVGIHFTDFRIGLSGAGGVAGSPPAAASEQFSHASLQPAVGLYGGLVLGPSWVVSGRADLLRFRLQGDDGQLLNLQASLVYRLDSRVGLGLGYRFNDYRLAGDGGFRGRLDWRLAGPQAFVDVGF